MNLVVAKRVLGVFSIGLGVFAVAAPERLAKFLGLDADEQSVSAFGAREIASGSGLLSPVKPGPWFWMRVGGDVMDLAALGKAVNRDNPRRHWAMGATALVAAIAIIDFAVAAHATLNKRENAEAAT